MLMIIFVVVDVVDVVGGGGDVDVDENLFRLSINSLQVHVDAVVDKHNKSSSTSQSSYLRLLNHHYLYHHHYHNLYHHHHHLSTIIGLNSASL